MLNLSTIKGSILRFGSSHRLVCQTWTSCRRSQPFVPCNFHISCLSDGRDLRREPFSSTSRAAGTLPVSVSKLIAGYPRFVAGKMSLSTRNHVAKTPAAAQEEAAPKVDKIVWDEERQRFRTPDGKAYLQYVIKPLDQCNTTKRKEHEEGKQVMLMQHTYVPGVFRGQGVAARLCVAAFQHCKDKGLLVLPICTYISDTFLPRNPNWENLVLKDGNTKSGL